MPSPRSQIFNKHNIARVLDNTSSNLNDEDNSAHSPKDRKKVLQCLSEALNAQGDDDPNYQTRLIVLLAIYKLEKMGFDYNEYNQRLDDYVAQFLVNGRRGSTNATVNDIIAHIINQVVEVERRPFRRRNRRLVKNERQVEISQNKLQIVQHEQQIPKLKLINNYIQPNQTNQMLQIICSICCQLRHEFLKSSCQHLFCIRCVKEYVHSNIESGNFAITCAQFHCEQIISNQCLRNILDKKQFTRFCYFKDKFEKQNNAQNKFCIKPDCGQVLSSNNNNTLVCPKCKTVYCEICLQENHEGRRCDQLLRNALQHTYDILRIKKCPNCKSPIEKIDGCNHMTCKKCKYQFCWICQGKYSRHHFKYYNCFGCPGGQYDLGANEVCLTRVKLILFMVLLPILLVTFLLFYFVAVGGFMIGSLLCGPLAWCELDSHRFEAAIVRNICCCLNECLRKMILWLLSWPRAVLCALFVAPIRVTVMIYEYLARMVS